MEIKNDKVKYVKFTSLRLTKPVSDDDWASLNWAIRLGYPRIVVYTTNKFVENKKLDPKSVIIAPFSYEALFTLISCLEELINSNIRMERIKSEISDHSKYAPPPDSYTIECWNKFDDKKVLQCKITVGRDDEGIFYIGVRAPEKPKIRFDILPNSTWHKYCGKDGEEITDKTRLSLLYAKAYVKVLTELMSSELIIDNKEELMLERKNKPISPTNIVTTNPAPVAQPVLEVPAEPIADSVKTIEPTPIEATTEIKVTDGDSLDDIF